MCAGTTDKDTMERDSCAGDSGGPLSVPLIDNRHLQIGIVSFGTRPCAEVRLFDCLTEVFSCEIK